MREVLAFFYKYINKWEALLYFLFSISQKVCLIIIPILSKKLIDTANTHGDINELNRYGIYLAITFLAFIVFLSLRYYFQNTIEVKVLNKLRMELFKKINHIPYLDLIERDSGYFIQRMNNDVGRVRSLIAEDFTTFAINIFFIAAILFIMLKLNLYLTLLLVLLFPVFVLFSKLVIPKIQSLSQKILENEEIINSQVEELLNNNYAVRAGNHQSFFETEFLHTLDRYYNTQIKEVKYEILYDFILVVGVMNAAHLLIYWLGANYVFSEKITIGTLLAFTLYFSRLWSPVEYFMGFQKRFKQKKVSLNRIRSFLSLKEEDSGSIDKLDGFEKLTIKDACLSFGNKKIFSNLNLSIKKGEKIGVIGENGAGKSTLANVLVKLIQLDSGRIYYNQIDYKNIDNKVLRKKIVLISQHPYVFGNLEKDLILQNTTMPDNLAEFINEKLDKKIYSKGTNLSGGEKKLINLWRSLNNEGEVFILDEPLAFVDKDKREIVIKLIKEYLKKKTCIVISHEKEILDFCDKVYKLENGKLHLKN